MTITVSVSSIPKRYVCKTTDFAYKSSSLEGPRLRLRQLACPHAPLINGKIKFVRRVSHCIKIWWEKWGICQHYRKARKLLLFANKELRHILNAFNSRPQIKIASCLHSTNVLGVNTDMQQSARQHLLVFAKSSIDLFQPFKALLHVKIQRHDYSLEIVDTELYNCGWWNLKDKIVMSDMYWLDWIHNHETRSYYTYQNQKMLYKSNYPIQERRSFFKSYLFSARMF